MHLTENSQVCIFILQFEFLSPLHLLCNHIYFFLSNFILNVFFLVSNITSVLKGKDTITEDLENNVLVPKRLFKDIQTCFEEWQYHENTCIASYGEYYKGGHLFGWVLIYSLHTFKVLFISILNNHLNSQSNVL